MGIRCRLCNLFLASDVVAGVIAWSAGDEAAGRALVIYTCLFMFLSGLVLLITDRMALSPRGKGLGGALAAGGPPLIALIAAVL